MKIGTVSGAVWATKKADGLTGQILLTVETERGTVIAADRVGAGTGDCVLVACGAAARAEDPNIPIDAAVVAILDIQGGTLCQ